MARGTQDDPGAVPGWVEPMLAKPDGGRLPSGRQWAYEYKLDGYRCAMRVAADGSTVLTSRAGNDITAEFLGLLGLLTDALEGRAAVLDGELVVPDPAGNADFELMQGRRGRYRHHTSSAQRDEPFEDVPVQFRAFDLLRLGDESLLAAPYEQRRAKLAELPMPAPELISVVDAFTFDALAWDGLTPHDLLDRAAQQGKEGLIVKKLGSPYQPGRRPGTWLKHPFTHTQEVIICGWRQGQKGFSGTLGGLLLGGHDPETGELVYLGDVGTGFSTVQRNALQARLSEMERPTHPFAEDPPREDVVRARWVRPVLVGEVEYRDFTANVGRLRHTAWRGLRDDRRPEEITAPQARTSPTSEAPEPERQTAPPVRSTSDPARVRVRVGERQLTLSNLDKELYPDGFTKGAVINYYSRIAPVLLPHLAGRPVTFIRFPNGVHGGEFFEKNVPNGAPPWLRTAVLPSRGSRGGGDTIRFSLLDDLPALVWAANLAALELHVPQWTVAPGPARGLPDRLVFDLDPGEGTTIVDCCRIAEQLRELLAADGLDPLASTSGSKGMQLYCGIHTDHPARPSAYAKQLAQQLAARQPDRVTATMTKATRAGRVLIDWSQNNPAKTTITPYSLRGRDHPTVATPVSWAEIHSCDEPGQLVFTSDEVLQRVDSHGDLMADLTTERARLPG